VWLSLQRTGLEGWRLTALRLGTSLAFAVVSYVALERPIRRGALSPRRALASATGGALAVAALLVLATHPPAATDGPAPWRIEPDGEGSLNVLLVGDSVAESLVPLLRKPAQARGLRIWSKAAGACTSMPHDVMRLAGGRVMIGDFCEAARAQWFAPERGFRPDVVLLIEGWAGIGDRRIDGRWLHPCDPAYDASYAQALRAVVERLAREAAPVAIALMPPVNAQRASDVVLGGAGVDRRRLVAIASQRMQCQNAVRRDIARRTGARLVDLASQVCPGGRCPAGDAAAAPRWDGLHFAGPAGRSVASWLVAELVGPDDAGR
jgi:lysophospholipase L1-like esterase